MSTVDWTAGEVAAGSAAAGGPHAPAEGLRARKKRLMRQQLSDVPTRMFVEL